MTSKLRIKVGEVEIDYEGTESFLKQELPELLKTAVELHRASGTAAAEAPKVDKGGKTRGGGGKLALTTATIAARLEAKSGSDLLLAAAAHLTLVDGVESFTRQQLLADMQSATSYYSTSYSANLSKYIKTALKKDGPLSEVAANSFALTATARKELETKLADG